MCKVAKGQGVSMTLEEATQARKIHAELFPEIIKYTGYRESRDDKTYAGESGWINTQAISYDKGGNPLRFAYEVNGRYRYNCTMCSALNGKAMQSLAADGAKEAIFLLTQYTSLSEPLQGVNPLAFIHDEVVFEIPDNGNEDYYMTMLCDLMIAGMKKVMPDVRVTVEASLMNRWTKDEDKHIKTLKRWSKI
jgi:hypothetical protein